MIGPEEIHVCVIYLVINDKYMALYGHKKERKKPYHEGHTLCQCLYLAMKANGCLELLDC